MKKTVISVTAALLLACCLFNTGCKKDEGNQLPPVVVKGIPENEAVRSSVTIDGFTIDIHITYAEITGYTGTSKELVLPEAATGVTIKSIGEEAFKANDKIISVKLPSGLLSIGKSAFESCTSLASAELCEGLESIGDYAFKGSGIASINFPDNVSTIGKYCFYGTKITTLKIPANISKVGKYAFYECTSLRSVEFCERISELSERMFYGCSALTEITIPKNVLKIEGYAFGSCTELEKVTMTAETTSLGEGIFAGSDKVTLYAPAGSEAEKCAKKNNYKFEGINTEE